MTDYQNIKTLIEENPYNETFCSAQGGSFYGHPKFAIKMLMPVLLAMFFTLPHWWNNEKKTSKVNKPMTFILVVLQFYPPVLESIFFWITLCTSWRPMFSRGNL